MMYAEIECGKLFLLSLKMYTNKKKTQKNYSQNVFSLEMLLFSQ